MRTAGYQARPDRARQGTRFNPDRKNPRQPLGANGGGLGVGGLLANALAKVGVQQVIAVLDCQGQTILPSGIVQSGDVGQESQEVLSPATFTGCGDIHPNLTSPEPYPDGGKVNTIE